MTESSPAPRRRARRILIVVGVALLLLLALLALLPTLISAGLGQGYIRDAIAKNVNGDVQISDVSLGWFSGQQIDGLRITDTAGKEAANVNIAVNNGLLSLALGRAKPIDVTVSGSLAGEVREDGSISFADLIDTQAKQAKKPPQPQPQPSPKKSEPFRAGDLPAINLNLANLTLKLDSVQHQQSLTIDNLTGKLAYLDPAQPITLDLHGKTTNNGTPGSLDVTGQADQLFAADGTFTLRGASAQLTINATGTPMPLFDRPATVETLVLKLASDDLTERIALNVDALGKIDDIAGESTVKIEGTLGKVIDGAGGLSFRAASAHINADVTNVPFKTKDAAGEIRTLTASIVSDDLTQKLDIVAQGDGVVNGAAGQNQQPSNLTANLSLAKPFSPEGKLQFAVENVTGALSGRNVPTALAHATLADTPIDAQRDLGPTIDIEASMPGGVAGDIRITAHTPKASAEFLGRVNRDDRSVAASKLTLSLTEAAPELIGGLTNHRVVTDRPLAVMIDLTSFAAQTENWPLDRITAKGTITITGPATVRMDAHAGDRDAANEGSSSSATASKPDEAPAIALESIDLNIESPALGEYLHVSGVVLAGGGRIDIDERITHLFDEQRQLALDRATPEGTLKIENLPADTIAAFLPRKQADIAMEVIGRGLNANVATSPGPAGLHTQLSARGERFDATIDLVRREAIEGTVGHVVQLDKTAVDLTLTPALAALLQTGSANPIVLGGPAQLHVDLEPVTLPMGAMPDLLAAPLSGRMSVTGALLEKVPAIAAPLLIPSLAMRLAIVERNNVITATITDGQGTLKRGGDSGGGIASLAMNGTVVIDPKEDIAPNLDVQLTELNTREAEIVLGQTPGAIANWTGDSGSVDVHVETVEKGYTARITPDMPNVQGTFTANLRDQMVSITAETSRLVLAKEALQARLNPQQADPTAAAAAPAADEVQIIVEVDAPMQVEITRCECPMNMLAGKPFEPKSVNIDLALRGGPLRFAHADGVKSSLSDLDVTLNSNDISKGVRFALKGTAEAIVPEPPPSDTRAARRDEREDQPAAAQDKPGELRTAEERRAARREERREARAETQPSEAPVSAQAEPPATQPQPQPGVLDVTGTLADVVNSEGKLDLAHGRLQMTANVTHVPTAVADALADMQGLLVAAVGPQMNGTFVADDFSANSGTLDAKIDTTNGRLEGLLRGRENSFRINKNAPVKAQLEITPALSQRLLHKIHPILADVRTTEQPLRIEIPSAVAAIPADVARLRAEMNITIGKVEFDAGSTTLKILSLFDRGDRTVIPGAIEPIAAQIRNGVVTYNKFTVHIDKYMLNYSGQVDLVKQTVDLRTEIPLAALKHDIEELRGYADSIVVPLVTRGKFGELKTSIDPDFDIGKAALDAGFKGTLDELLRGEGGFLRDLLEKKEPE